MTADGEMLSIDEIFERDLELKQVEKLPQAALTPVLC
jgi:hypothetical protein